MNDVLERFSKLLETRLGKRVFTTEDSVRYTFFAALLDVTNLKPEQVILEYSHPAIDGAKVDTWIQELLGETVAIEFKYDRKIPSGKNSPKPQKAGKLFHDLYRLLVIDGHDPIRKIFVYLTSEEMAKYMRKSKNGLNDFFSLKQGEELEIKVDFFTNKAPTLQKAASPLFNAKLVSLWNQSLPKDHELRVYEVHSQ